MINPTPLTEASTRKLYRWSDRMVRIMDLMIEARGCAARGDETGVTIAGEQLGELADQQFLNDLYDLFKQLANRQSGA